MDTIDPDVKPTSKQGSAYLQMGEVTIFGVPVLPSEVSKALGESVMVQLYDFHAEPKTKIEGKKTVAKEFDAIPVMKSFVLITLGLLLLAYAFFASTQPCFSQSSALSAVLLFVGVSLCSAGWKYLHTATTFTSEK